VARAAKPNKAKTKVAVVAGRVVASGKVKATEAGAANKKVGKTRAAAVGGQGEVSGVVTEDGGNYPEVRTRAAAVAGRVVAGTANEEVKVSEAVVASKRVAVVAGQVGVNQVGASRDGVNPNAGNRAEGDGNVGRSRPSAASVNRAASVVGRGERWRVICVNRS
jgi:hypothetical protein